MVAFLTPLANDGIGYNFGFVFAGCNIAIALLVWFFLYETVGLSLENVDQMYSQPELKPWTSHKWVPAGYNTRKKRDPVTFGDEITRVGSDEFRNGKPTQQTVEKRFNREGGDSSPESTTPVGNAV
jgi:SP family sugar:H+ symporter-like MFS transporter